MLRRHPRGQVLVHVKEAVCLVGKYKKHARVTITAAAVNDCADATTPPGKLNLFLLRYTPQQRLFKSEAHSRTAPEIQLSWTRFMPRE